MPVAVDQAPIGGEILERHAARGETLLKTPADFLAGQLRNPIKSSDRAFFILDDEAGQSVIDDFSNRPAIERDDRSAACHRFYHDEAERLRPVDRIEQREGTAEKFRLLRVRNF